MYYYISQRPGELFFRSISDFMINWKGKLILLEGLKGTPNLTNQSIRSDRVLREWVSMHLLSGDIQGKNTLPGSN